MSLPYINQQVPFSKDEVIASIVVAGWFAGQGVLMHEHPRTRPVRTFIQTKPNQTSRTAYIKAAHDCTLSSNTERTFRELQEEFDHA